VVKPVVTLVTGFLCARNGGMPPGGENRMRRKHVVPADRRTTVAVDRDTHVALKLYASERRLTVTAAAVLLLRDAILREEGLAAG
jgi:hypothetical protein